MTHFRDECEHGLVVRQCRCPGPNKTVHRVPCATVPAHDDRLADRDGPGCQTTYRIDAAAIKTAVAEYLAEWDAETARLYGGRMFAGHVDRMANAITARVVDAIIEQPA